MGEIIFSIFCGSWMVFTGIFLIVYLNREQKSWESKEGKPK